MNPNTQLYTVINLGFEFFAGGSVVKNDEIRSLKLSKYSGANGTLLLILQLITLVFIAYFLYSEAKELVYNRCEYFKVFFYIGSDLELRMVPSVAGRAELSGPAGRMCRNPAEILQERIYKHHI